MQLHPPKNKGDATTCNPPATALQPAKYDPPAPNPDRFAWPHSSAWNVAELERFAARQARFLSLGLAARQAETLAAQLVQRDRGLDDRRACPECAHYRRGSRCANAIGAGTDIRRTVADIPQALAVLLQRCDGFSEAKYF